jgi:nicotinate-nucleotide adenylyltransferase
MAMVKRERAGFLGGTFDPIHVAHLIIAEECHYHLTLNRVFFVPAGSPPHKQENPITDAEHRVAMVQLAIDSNPCFVLSKLDVDRGGPCYSVDTVQLLQDQLGPEVEICFIIGMDSLLEMPTWHDPMRLIRLCWFAVVGRPGYQVAMESLESLLPGLSSRVTFVEAPEMSFSSSDIRHRVRSGFPIRYQVPDAVEEYIYAHKLYR